MTVVEKLGTALGAIVVFLIAAFFVSFWWSTKTPRRPASVAKNAVFLWAPHVGLPAPRRGWWLSCRYDGGHDYCTLSDMHGNTEYDGEFTTYRTETAELGKQLIIDPDRTTEQKIWVGEKLVPLVYLQNGTILIPRENYGAGVRALQ